MKSDASQVKSEEWKVMLRKWKVKSSASQVKNEEWKVKSYADATSRLGLIKSEKWEMKSEE